MSCRPCQGWHAFLQSPGKWAGFLCHDKVVQMVWSRLVCRICHVTIKLSRWCAKTMIRQLAEASACKPIDFVSVAGTVRVAQDFISGLNFSLIDF